MLTVEHLAVFYGDVQALWDVSLAITEGKSSPSSARMGLAKPPRCIPSLVSCGRARGALLLPGKSCHREAPQRIVEAGLIHIAEGRELFPYMTVLENLELGAFAKRARRQRRQTLDYVMDLFPQAARAATAAGRHAERRGTANGRHWPGTDGPAASAHAG